MGFYRGPNIVRDSLIFHVDAGSYRSYPVTGSHWLDISGNGNDFQIYGNPTWDKEGFQMDEVWDRFEDGLQIDNDETSFSVEAYYMFHQTDGAYGPVITRWQTSGNNNNEFYLGNNDGATGPGYAVMSIDNTAGTAYEAYSTELSTTGVWYHQVGTFDGTTVRVYMDGVEKDNVTFSGTAKKYRTQPIGIGVFGDYMESGSALYEAALKIRYARMYSRALTADEVLQNYNATKGRFQ